MSAGAATPGNAAGRTIPELLSALGWNTIIAAEPSASTPDDGRTDYYDELIIDRFRERVRRINPGPDGEPWLDETRLDFIGDRVRGAAGAADLVSANKTFTELLLQGLVVQGLPAWGDGRSQRVRIVDWDTPEGNDLRVIRNFRLDRQTDGGVPSVVLDYVLFVNGLPLAVIRDPAPDREATVSEAIADLRSYTGARPDGPRESVPRFFAYSQVLVATDGIEYARLGTITAGPEHFSEWRTIEPTRPNQIRAELGISPNRLTGLEQLVIGVLRPAHLLDLIRNFTAFHQPDDREVKLIARYSQFRAVHRIVYRLTTGTPGTSGRRDERGGVVWHTQGSGKSFTMAFLIRKLRSTGGLQDYKVVVAVDRVNLRDQLSDSLALANETVRQARGVMHARQLLSDGVPDVVMMMMQHAQRDDDAGGFAGGEERLGSDVVDDQVRFPELTRSQKVIVIADEAHRTQGGWLRARLRHGLPGAAWIGFTGTPLTSEDRRRNTTIGIFGPFFDRYRLQDAVHDGATVPIRYEQRRADAFVVDRVALDAEYEREVGGTPEDRESAQRRLTTRQALEAEDLIGEKARDMLRHWVSTVLPNGFKAQVATATRLAAVRYRAALIEARDELLAELNAYAAARRRDPEAPRKHPDGEFLEAALPFAPLLAVIVFIPVISAGQRRDPDTGQRQDPPEWAQWTAENAQRWHVGQFKERLPAPEIIGSSASGTPADDTPWAGAAAGSGATEPPAQSAYAPEPWFRAQPDDELNHGGERVTPEAPPGPGSAPVAFIIVQSMLLTGFDAPVEQVLYLDRPIRGVELLQAIARVNRLARQKTVGLVVDYAGISGHLDAALASYGEEDLGEARTFLVEDDVPRLRHARDAVRSFLAAHGISSLADQAGLDKLLVLLEDPRLRAEFDDLLGEFFLYLDRVLPREEALRYEDDARVYGAAQYRVRSCFRDTRSGRLDPYTYGAKVRRLIDEHLRVIGIAEHIPPVEITAADFHERVAMLDSPRVRALEMEHALRRHLAERQPSDPAYYERLSERLDRLLEQLRDDAQRLAAALDALIHELREREAAATEDGLDPRTERPIRSMLEKLFREDTAVRRATAPTVSVDALNEITRRLAVMISRGVGPPHFMSSAVLQESLRKTIYGTLYESDLYSREAAARGAQNLLALVRANRDFYLGDDGEPDLGGGEPDG